LSLVAFSSLKKLDTNLTVSMIYQFSGLQQSQNALNTHTNTHLNVNCTMQHLITATLAILIHQTST